LFPKKPGSTISRDGNKRLFVLSIDLFEIVDVDSFGDSINKDWDELFAHVANFI
jgi:hypothetical protein